MHYTRHSHIVYQLYTSMLIAKTESQITTIDKQLEDRDPQSTKSVHLSWREVCLLNDQRHRPLLNQTRASRLGSLYYDNRNFRPIPHRGPCHILLWRCFRGSVVIKILRRHRNCKKSKFFYKVNFLCFLDKGE